LLTCSTDRRFTVTRAPPAFEEHTNFTDESACLTADIVGNEVVTIHRSQNVFKMLSLYMSQLIVSLKDTGTTILLALMIHRIPIFTGWSGLRGLDVDSVNCSTIILRIYVSLQVKPRFIRKECQLRIDLTFDDCRNQLHKLTLLAGSRGCKACLDYFCFIGSELQQLCCPSCIRL
jgi:hypothetical protein